jgi:hypothetical protein
MSKSEEERNRLKDEFDQIQSEGGEFDISKHLAKAEDLPDLGEIEIYDYDSDLTVSSQQSMDVLETLIDLYLSDIPQLMTRKNFLNQLRQVDNGDNSARMHEVVNQTIGQIRENSKFLMGQRTELEKFYKTLRRDLGYHEIDNPEIKQAELENNSQESSDGGEIMDNRKLNELIKNAMINKDNDRKG